MGIMSQSQQNVRFTNLLATHSTQTTIEDRLNLNTKTYEAHEAHEAHVFICHKSKMCSD